VELCGQKHLKYRWDSDDPRVKQYGDMKLVFNGQDIEIIGWRFLNEVCVPSGRRD